MEIINTHYMRKDQTGIDTSCKYIDAAIEELNANKCEELNSRQIGVAIVGLETARNIHESLRELANYSIERINELGGEVASVEAKVKELKQQVLDKDEEIRVLEEEKSEILMNRSYEIEALEQKLRFLSNKENPKYY